MIAKKKPTKDEWNKIRILYLKGVKPRHIVDKFPYLDITAKAISSKFSNNKTKEKRDKLKQKIEDKLLDSIAEQQINANNKLIDVTNKIVDVIGEYLKKEQYKDFAGYNYGKMMKTRSDTLNTFAFNQVVKALAEAQKIQQSAYRQEEQDKLPTPVININFGEE